MFTRSGKFENQSTSPGRHTLILLPLGFFLIEVFAFFFLSTVNAAGDLYAESRFEQQGYTSEALSTVNLWPLAFGAVWAVLLTALVRLPS